MSKLKFSLKQIESWLHNQKPTIKILVITIFQIKHVYYNHKKYTTNGVSLYNYLLLIM